MLTKQEEGLIEVSQSLLSTAERLCTGANIHGMRGKISNVQFWIKMVKKDISEELKEKEGIIVDEMLRGAMQELFEACCKAEVGMSVH